MSGPGGINHAVRIDRGSQGGFTLIELVVVLVIISVMAGVAAPALIAPRSAITDLEEAVNRFDVLFRLARESAVRSARPVTVVVDSISGMVWFDSSANQSGGPLSSTATTGQISTVDIGVQIEGAFGGGSTLGQGLGDPGAGARVPDGAQSLTLPDGITIEYLMHRSLFTFTANGSAVGDSLRLRSFTGETCLITVDPWRGHVRVR